jgi:DNA-binding MarR family transcriptional regulator
MTGASEQCARDVLETVPVVMRFIRDEVHQRRTASLSLLQFRTLAFLSHVNNSSLSAVAEHLGLSLPAMSRLINGLVNNRLVERQTVSTNRRQIALTLTAQGRATLEKVRGEIRRQLASSLKTLPAAERMTIQRAMRVLHRVFGSQPADKNLAHKIKT